LNPLFTKFVVSVVVAVAVIMVLALFVSAIKVELNFIELFMERA